LRWTRRSKWEQGKIEEMLAVLDACGANETQLAQFDQWWEQHVTSRAEEFIYHPYDLTRGVLRMQTDRENQSGRLELYRWIKRYGSTGIDGPYPYQPGPGET
jgi:hypothetical protein